MDTKSLNKLEDTKGVIRICHSKQDRQYNDEMVEDTKGVTRSRHSKQDRQYNDEMLINNFTSVPNIKIYGHKIP
jgi:hypothetical protein